jgi:hypothetical protein
MRLLVLIFPILTAACTSAPGPVVPETRVERQMIGLLEKFDRWDYNGDGQLTVDELEEARKSGGHDPEKILAFYDKDRSGGISLREAQAGYARSGEAEGRLNR